jgi:hypothetical protein
MNPGMDVKEDPVLLHIAKIRYGEASYQTLVSRGERRLVCELEISGCRTKGVHPLEMVRYLSIEPRLRLEFPTLFYLTAGESRALLCGSIMRKLLSTVTRTLFHISDEI